MFWVGTRERERERESESESEGERGKERREKKRVCVCVVLEEEARQSLASDGGIQVRGFDWKMVRQRPEV